MISKEEIKEVCKYIKDNWTKSHGSICYHHNNWIPDQAKIDCIAYSKIDRIIDEGSIYIICFDNSRISHKSISKRLIKLVQSQIIEQRIKNFLAE